MKSISRYIASCAATASLLCCVASAQETQPQGRAELQPASSALVLPEGVTVREVTFYSDDVACFAKLFLPKGFAATGSTPGIVLAPGWTSTHASIESFGARFAEKGLVAMVIDYRGWGKSDGFATLVNKDLQSRERNDDAQRRIRGEIRIEEKRTRIVPAKQIEDIRNAISYLQGEPGVDPNRIGVWGVGMAGGHAISVAALDARVKALALQAPSIAGKGTEAVPFAPKGKMLEDAIQRARTGKGGEIRTGAGRRHTIDAETNQLLAEHRPFKQLKHIGDRPVLFVIAEKDEVFDNEMHAIAAANVLSGPKKVIEVPNATHYALNVGAAFDISANAAADWFVQYLGVRRQGQ